VRVQFTEFWQRFVAAEARGRALEVRLLGMQLYPVLRTRIYYELAQKLGIFDDPHPDPNSDAVDSTAADQQPALPEQPPEQPPAIDLAALSPAHDVVVPFVRRVAGVDPYSQTVYDALLARAASPEAKPLRLEFSEPAAALDIERIRAWGRSLFEAWVAEETIRQKVRDHEERWLLLTTSLKAEFGVELEKFHEYPRWFFRRYIAEAKGFELVFRALQTKRLFIVNAYSNPAIVVGAKLAGAKVIEIQHGFISPYHPAYSYPRALNTEPGVVRGLISEIYGGRPRVQTAPDRILCWGSYWAEAADFAAGTRAIVSGPSAAFAKAVQHFRSQAAARSSRIVDFSGVDTGPIDPVELARAKSATILFSSQGAVGPRLFAAAAAFARELPQHRVIYRLHPNESLDSYRALEVELGLDGLENLELSHREPAFIDLLAEVDYLVGGFSTTLFEGLAFGLRVLVLPLPGYENLQPALDAKDMTRIVGLDPEQIRAALEAATPPKDPGRYYAETIDLAKALRA